MSTKFLLVSAAALGLVSSANAATLVADYEFNGNLDSSVAGAPALVAVDPLNAASFSGGVYNWGGSNSPPSDQGGLTFDNSGGLLPADDYSVELLFKFNEGNNAWRRILDVQNRGSDDGLYISPSNNLDVYPVAGGSSPFSTGTYYTVLLTVGGGVATGYLDGVQQFSVATTVMNINNQENVVNLFLDNLVGGGQGEWSSGSIDYAKFYSGVVTPIPEPSAWVMMTVGFACVGLAGLSPRRKRAAA